jgi:hypothetical protein
MICFDDFLIGVEQFGRYINHSLSHAARSEVWRLRPTFPTVRGRSLMKSSAFGFRIIELHIAIWHTGSHVDHEKCLFFNLKNMDTNKSIFTA